LVSVHADSEADIIFGAIIDDDLGVEMKVTVIAAGFEGRRRPMRPSVRAADDDTSRARYDEDDLDIPSFVQG
jgi:cell division protein FtsZ